MVWTIGKRFRQGSMVWTIGKRFRQGSMVSATINSRVNNSQLTQTIHIFRKYNIRVPPYAKRINKNIRLNKVKICFDIHDETFLDNDKNQ